MPALVPLLTRAFRRVWSSSVSWSFGVVALRAGGFLLVLPLAVRLLTPGELGLWYVFVSIAELCSFAELGLSIIISRNASFFMAGLDRVPVSGLAPSQVAEGAPPNYAGLSGLLHLARRIYVLIGLGIFATMLLAGWIILTPKLATLPGSRTGDVAAYGIYAFSMALSIYSQFWPHFLSGIGHVRLSQRCMMVGLILNYAVSALALALGFGTLSLALGQLVLAATVFWMARRLVLRVCAPVRTTPPQPVALGELWPSTWRTLLTAMGGYTSLYGTVFVCGVVMDLATTASYGLSFRLATVLHSVAGVWLQVRLPGIATARAGGQAEAARHLVANALPRCLATFASGAVALCLAGPFFLELIHSKTPLLPTPQLVAIMVLTGLDFLVGFHSVVIQSASRFPHLPGYLAGGLASMALAFVLSRSYGVVGIMAAPMIVQSLWAYWGIPILCWRELRVEKPAVSGS